MATQFPVKKVTFDRVIAEGKIVEHWDELPLAPDKAANHNTMF